MSRLKGQHLPLQIWVPGTATGGTLPDKYASLGIDTRLNVDRFRQLRDAGIPVTLASDDADDLPIIASHIQQSVTQQNNARQDLHWKNSGYLLIAPMLFLLLFWRRQLLMVALLFPALLWSPHSDAAWLDAGFAPIFRGSTPFAAATTPLPPGIIAIRYGKVSPVSGGRLSCRRQRVSRRAANRGNLAVAGQQLCSAKAVAAGARQLRSRPLPTS